MMLNLVCQEHEMAKIDHSLDITSTFYFKLKVMPTIYVVLKIKKSLMKF